MVTNQPPPRGTYIARVTVDDANVPLAARTLEANRLRRVRRRGRSDARLHAGYLKEERANVREQHLRHAADGRVDGLSVRGHVRSDGGDEHADGRRLAEAARRHDDELRDELLYTQHAPHEADLRDKGVAKNVPRRRDEHVRVKDALRLRAHVVLGRRALVAVELREDGAYDVARLPPLRRRAANVASNVVERRRRRGDRHTLGDLVVHRIVNGGEERIDAHTRSRATERRPL